MSVLWFIAVLLSQASTETKPQPMSSYELGPASIEGAKLTVSRLLQATQNQDDAAYDKVARGMVVMLAPDFGMPVDRAQFGRSLAECSAPQVVSSKPDQNMPQAQIVRIAMKCTDKQHSTPVAAVADIMADDAHTFMVFPGGIDAVWPSKAKR